MKPLTVLHLYPRDMNIYGDRGNVLTLLKRLEWHGYEAKLTEYNPGDRLPTHIDLIVGGGGQDSGQLRVEEDLQIIGDTLRRLADDDVPMLLICGLYQLFGRRFITQDGGELRGIGIFAAETIAKPKRLVGNVIVNSPFGKLLGYENHSGLTTLDNPAQALGRIIKGAGNNGEDHTEGAIYRSVFGSYMHGSLLPKNPVFADMLIERAVTRLGIPFTPRPIDDQYAELARKTAGRRPR